MLGYVNSPEAAKTQDHNTYAQIFVSFAFDEPMLIANARGQHRDTIIHSFTALTHPR